MKSLLNLRYLYKVHSKRIVEAGMNLTLDYNEAIRNQEVISLASSTTLRMIEDIVGEGWKEKEKKMVKIIFEINFFDFIYYFSYFSLKTLLVFYFC